MVIKKSEKNTQKLGLWFFAIIFPSLFLIAGSIFLYNYFKTRSLAQQSQNWPETSGTIEYALYSPKTGRFSASFHILYFYQVDGQQYSSSNAIFGAVSSKDAKELSELYPAQSRVTVYYNPLMPSLATLAKRTGSATAILAIFGLIFLVTGCLLLYFILNAIKNSDFSSSSVIVKNPEHSTGRLILNPITLYHHFLERSRGSWSVFISMLFVSLVLFFVCLKMLDKDQRQQAISANLIEATGELGHSEIKKHYYTGISSKQHGIHTTKNVNEYYIIALHYNYIVDGKSYQSQQIGFAPQLFKSYDQAQQTIQFYEQQQPLRVYYQQDQPQHAVLDPTYEPNRTDIFFWVFLIIAVLNGLITLQLLKQLKLIIPTWFQPMSKVLIGLLITAITVDLAYTTWHFPSARRLQKSYGFLNRHGDNGSWFPVIQVSISYKTPSGEYRDGGKWRPGANFVWSSDAAYELRQKFPSGESHPIWIDPEQPWQAYLSNETGSIFGLNILALFTLLVLLLAKLGKLTQNPKSAPAL